MHNYNFNDKLYMYEVLVDRKKPRKIKMYEPGTNMFCKLETCQLY